MDQAQRAARAAQSNLRFTLISILLAVGIFANDLVLLRFTLVGQVPIAGGVPYVALVMVSLWFRGRGYPQLLGALSTFLTLAGFGILAMYYPAILSFGEIINRILAIFAIWMTTLLCLQHKRTEDALHDAHADLERKVEDRTADLKAANAMLEQEMAHRKSTQQQLLQQQDELAHIARLSTMGEMATGLAHELNQPLTSIVNYAQGCLRRIGGGGTSPADLVNALEQISSEAARAGEIIRRTRRFIRKREPQRMEVHLDELVGQVLALMRHELQMSDVAVRLDVPPTLPPVAADRIQLQQVVVNLVRNSMEAMESVDRTRRAIEITALFQPDGPQVVVSVRDQGCGLPPGNEDKVFEAFYTTKPEGTGMGLAISRTIIAAHGGHLSASRNPDGGSTFRFSLPVSVSQTA